MITLVITLISIAVYLVIGFSIGKQDLPRRYEVLEQCFPNLYKIGYYGWDSYDASARTNRRTAGSHWLIVWTLFWPFIAPVLLGRKFIVWPLQDALASQTEKADPAERELKIKDREREIEERERRIEQLERELGIGK